ncbi:hypothetical protein M404DRAFT_30866 [Pisolithus tinctorius Marx 270]|uniref:Integrase catalytic domain-containing protein n=1 Tax=Pisolithus tinctorius Marx 270 TaxID=870435 RepID=A0A0C3IQ44_PISTI|nr:hypothetical protein M404DRAFT_30866 [Pisolithus tinctorius Marx 270]
MDFIEHLLASSGHTTIVVVVDQLSKQAIFIPTHNTITSPELAKLFLLHVFSKHSVLAHVTSDQGSEFVLHFFQSLGKALDMHLHFTSGYHPEGDGQTKQANQTLEQYLWVYCNYQQDNWAELLPLAEFAYNNALSATTSVSPFFANKGYHPNLSVFPERDLSSARAMDYAMHLDKLHQFLQEEMALAQARYQGPADAKRLPVPKINLGEQVYVKAKYFQTTRPSQKLADKNLGPYSVIAQPSTHSFTLHLPDSMCAPPPPLVEVDGKPEYKIAKILDSKVDQQQKCRLQYLVHWAGYEGTDEETSWLLATKLGNAEDLLTAFHASYPDKPRPTSS